MELHKFNPIKNKEQLLETIEYTHFKCFELCKKVLGKYLSVSGNIGIFCHSDKEYVFLTKLRQELTDELDNWNKKYYRLHKPIIIPSNGGVPDTTYTYLYIRNPDKHTETGDADFVLNKKEYMKLKNSLLKGEKVKGLKIFDRPELDLMELSDPNIDVFSFIGTKNMTENIKVKKMYF
jgi:hypothetical protein